MKFKFGPWFIWRKENLEVDVRPMASLSKTGCIKFRVGVPKPTGSVEEVM